MPDNEIEIILKMTDQASNQLDSASRSTDQLSKSQAGLASAAKIAKTAFLAGITAIIGGLTASVKMAMEAEKIQSQLNAVIESTGGAAGLSADEINEMAKQLSRLTGIEDDSIVKTSAVMLTFTKIGKETFPKAMEAVLDMSVALGTDMQSAAIQVGKALNDPIKGVTALQRVGVSFTEGQKDVIRSLVETGDVAGAQAMILEELATEFGGVAEAAGETLEGKLNKAKNSIGNLGEAIGGALIPVLGDAAEGLNNLFEGVNNVTDALDDQKKQALLSADSYEEYNDRIVELQKSVPILGLTVQGVTEDEFENQKQLQALEEWHGKWDRAMALSGENISYLISQGIQPLTQEHLQSGLIPAVEDVTALFNDFSAQLMFNLAAANLDADAQFYLAKQMGLIDDETWLAYEAMQGLTEALQTGKIEPKEYADHTNALYDAISKLEDKEITITTNYVDTYTSVGGQKGGPVPYEQVGGWVDAGRSYVVGDNGPEPFTPNVGGVITPNHVVHNWNLTINEAGRVVDPVYSFMMLRSLAG